VATSTLRRAARAAVTSAAVFGAVLAGAAPASAELNPGQLRTVTDQYLFSTSLSQFGSIRNQAPYADQLDWGSDACSNSPDNPFGFEFTPACHRHDFGYRNYKRQSRFTEDNRLRIDNNFKSDLYKICNGNWACNRIADIYYAAVREFGDNSISTKAALDRADVDTKAAAVAASTR